MKLADWPESERPREKMERMGPQSLGDAELVALLLGTGRAGENAYEISMRILGRLGGLHGMDSASVRELTTIPGIGPAKAMILKAAMELGRRTIGAASASCSIRSSRDLFNIVAPRFHGLDHERFYAAFLDSGLRLQELAMISLGSTSACLLDTRLLLRDALSKGACSIALAHNHPSGECRPSMEDTGITEKIALSLETVGLRLLDHLIICEERYYSYADSGLINFRSAKGIPRPGSLQVCDRPVPWSPCRP
jgi:DNA repair protein RadC